MEGPEHGAGACYDATAYKGLRFRIRGTVTTPDATLVDRAVITLITAQTQTRKLGGDLNGEGGHFHRVVPLSPEWGTVELTWEEFDRPSWGLTTSMTSLALDRMQSVDFGVSNLATAFEVYIDDIELF